MKRKNGMTKQILAGLKQIGQRFGLVLGLLLTIMISIVLSVILWWTPGNSKMATDSEANKQLLATKPITSIYDFNQLLVVDKNAKIKAVMNFKATTTKMVKYMNSWELGTVQKKKVSVAEYMQTLRTPNTYVMSFPAPVSTDIIKSIFGANIILPRNAEVTHVQMSRTKKNIVRLFDDQHHQIYQFKVTAAAKSLDTISLGAQKIPVTIQYHKRQMLTDYQNAITLKSYRYLVATSEASSFVSTLFSGNKQTPNPQVSGDVTTYGTTNKQLKINSSSDLVTFDNYDAKSIKATFNGRLKAGYNWLVMSRQLSDNIYYFESSDDGRLLTYRLYVNGLPIFNQSDFGTVRIEEKTTTHLQISFSQYSLQVPLPSKTTDDVILPSSATVFKELAAAGVKKNDVDKIQIGYRWVTAKDSTKVTLKPEWYFESHSTWHAVFDYLNQK